VVGLAADPGWLRGCPAWVDGSADDAAVAAARAALGPWMARHVLGQSVATWLAAWEADPAAHLHVWSARSAHPLARWLQAVRPQAEALVIPCRALQPLAESAGLRRLAAALVADPGFAQQPVWDGVAAETGPWTRRRATLGPGGAAGAEPAGGSAGTALPATAPMATAWWRIGARLADLLRLVGPAPWLDRGAIPLAPGEALAWTEMSRGLLVHWVKLAPAGKAAAVAAEPVVEACRVLAPTEWNLHPAGALAARLAAGDLDDTGVRVAVAAFDPCVACRIEPSRSAA